MCAILKCFTSPVNNYILLFQFSTMTSSDPLCAYFISSDSHVQQLTKTSYRLKKNKSLKTTFQCTPQWCCLKSCWFCYLLNFLTPVVIVYTAFRPSGLLVGLPDGPSLFKKANMLPAFSCRKGLELVEYAACHDLFLFQATYRSLQLTFSFVLLLFSSSNFLSVASILRF